MKNHDAVTDLRRADIIGRGSFHCVAHDRLAANRHGKDAGGDGNPFAWIFETCRAVTGVGPSVVITKLPFKYPFGNPGTFSVGTLICTWAVLPLIET